MESAVNGLGVIEQRDNLPEAGSLLLLDADLAESAANCAPLIDPVVTGEADLTIAVLPAQFTDDGGAPGGFGLVVNAARRGIDELTGWTPQAPLSGQRCITRRAFELASPLAAGWGLEVGMTIDVLRAGLKISEIEIDLRHRATGSDLGAQLHRAAQLRDVTRALGGARPGPSRAQGSEGLRRGHPGCSSDSEVSRHESMTAAKHEAPDAVIRPSRRDPRYRPEIWHRNHQFALFGIVGATALTLLVGFLGPSAVTLTLGPRHSYLPPWYLPAGVVKPNEWFVSILIWAAIILGALGLWVGLRATG